MLPPGTYAGWTFAPGATRREVAEVTIGTEGVRGRGAQGQVLVPWSALRLELVGNFSDMVMCHDRTSGAIVCSDDRGFLSALREHGGPVAREQVDAFRSANSRRRLLRRGLLLASLTLVALLIGGLWWVATAGLDHAVEALPPSVDRSIGDQAFASMHLTAIDAPKATAAIETIVSRLAGAAKRSDFEFRVQLVDDAQINAFALPGGQIVVYTGLLKQATRAEQVAGVLGHEMAHVTLRHGVHGAAKQAGLLIAFEVVVGDASGLAGLGEQLALSAATNGYGRGLERAADAEGARMLAASNIDIHGLTEFFAKLKDVPGSEATGAAGWFSDHPGHDERIAAIEAIARKLQPTPPPALDIDWAAVQQDLVKK
jgi:Zn-dependent protease with chaperone function